MERNNSILDMIIMYFIIFIFGAAFGYYWRINQEINTKPIAVEPTVSEIFRIAQEDPYTSYISYGDKVLKIVPRKDKGVLLRFEGKD